MEQEPFTLPDEVTVITITDGDNETATIAVPRIPHHLIYDHDGNAWATDARTTDPDWLGIAMHENTAKARAAAEQRQTAPTTPDGTFYRITTANGTRRWYAVDEAHAVEQHGFAFPGDEYEAILEVAPERYAVITDPARSPLTTVERYLPANYTARQIDGTIVIVGTDNHGWGMITYVIPRLASGMHRADEHSFGDLPDEVQFHLLHEFPL